jgi:16S rRNA G966 N2-methylase RsmD
MGLEALSSGAEKLVMCDKSPQALATISANVKKIPARLVDKVTIIKATFPRDLDSPLRHGPFSLIFLDPPYNDPIDNILSILSLAAQNQLASPKATVVWEQDPKSLKLWDPDSLVPWEVTLTRRWGKKAAAVLDLSEAASAPPRAPKGETTPSPRF